MYYGVRNIAQWSGSWWNSQVDFPILIIALFLLRWRAWEPRTLTNQSMWLWEVPNLGFGRKFLINFRLYEGPGTEFGQWSVIDFLVDAVKLKKPISKCPRSCRGHHNMTKGACRLVPGWTEVAVLWLCIPNLLRNFLKSVPYEVKST